MNKLSKKMLCFTLACSMLLSVSACGKSKSEKSKETETTQAEEQTGSRLQADWVNQAIMYEVNVRQYTEEGTFKAFEQHLDRLKEMGINTLWFMPIYSIAQENKKGTLGSYYSIQDYKSVNSEFGTMDDFKELVNTAHDKGFKIVLDWVANHTGFDHTWITEHPDYYVKDENGDIISPLNTDWDDVAQLNFQNNDMRAAMIDAMKFWVQDIGVDGFRCDYAQGVPIDFWETARTELDKIKPIYMVAEDGTNSDSLLNKAFDSNYNFALYDSLKLSSKVNNGAADVSKKITSDLPYAAFKMNFIDNHDKNSWDGTMESRFGKDTIGALTTIMFTAEGMPLVYSGDEEDINLSLQFFEKDNINFGDYKYKDLLTALCHIKTENTPLYNGIYGAKVKMIKNDTKSVLSYTRKKDGTKITVIVNLASKEQNVKYDDSISKGTVLLHGDSTGKVDTSGAELDTKQVNKLQPWEYYVIKSSTK